MSLDSYTYEDLQEELKRRDAEKKRLESLPPDKRLAEVIHNTMCSWNHTDGCSWFYETGHNKWNETAHKNWLTKAQRVLRIVDSFPANSHPVNLIISALKAIQ